MLFERYGKAFSKIPAWRYNNLNEEQHIILQHIENSYYPVNSAEAADLQQADFICDSLEQINLEKIIELIETE